MWGSGVGLGFRVVGFKCLVGLGFKRLGFKVADFVCGCWVRGRQGFRANRDFGCPALGLGTFCFHQHQER